MKRKKKISPAVDWNAAFSSLFKKYKGRKHPLKYENPYQLIVMIVLSARASDLIVNNLAPALFAKYPSFNHLAAATPEELYPLVKVPGFRKKAEWIIGIAKAITATGRIPTTIESLTALKGFGRKSANVYMSQVGLPAEGVIVDLHTLRVAPRIGIAKGDDPKQIELQLMKAVERKHWHQLGMSLTYLGREICRPTNPHCEECPVRTVCSYYAAEQE